MLKRFLVWAAPDFVLGWYRTFRGVARDVRDYRLFRRGRYLPKVTVYVQTNGVCTNRCLACPTYGQERVTARMSDEMFHAIVDELVENRWRIGMVNLYNHNEPQTDPKIFSRLEYLRSRLGDTEISHITNFVPVNRKQAEKLAAAPIDKLTHGMYGLDAKSYAGCCGRDHFHRYFNNLIGFVHEWVATRNYAFRLIFLIGTPNIHDYEFVKYFMELLPVNQASLSPVCQLPSSVEDIPLEEYRAKGRRPGLFCSSLFASFKIGPQGNVYGCTNDASEGFCYGNIADEGSAFAVAYGRRAEEMRRGIFHETSPVRRQMCERCYCMVEKKPGYMLRSLFPGAGSAVETGEQELHFYNGPAEVDAKYERFRKLFPREAEDYTTCLEAVRKDFLASRTAR